MWLAWNYRELCDSVKHHHMGHCNSCPRVYLACGQLVGFDTIREQAFSLLCEGPRVVEVLKSEAPTETESGDLLSGNFKFPTKANNTHNNKSHSRSWSHQSFKWSNSTLGLSIAVPVAWEWDDNNNSVCLCCVQFFQPISTEWRSLDSTWTALLQPNFHPLGDGSMDAIHSRVSDDEAWRIEVPFGSWISWIQKPAVGQLYSSHRIISFISGNMIMISIIIIIIIILYLIISIIRASVSLREAESPHPRLCTFCVFLELTCIILPDEWMIINLN